MAEGGRDILNYKDIDKNQDYTIFRDTKLGSGTFGSVYEGFDNVNVRKIAVKHINNASIEYSAKEIDILSKLTEHDNIVRIYDSFVYVNDNWIVMQLCKGPSMDKFLQDTNPNMRIREEIAEQIIEAVQYMHNANPRTAHRDMKPPNIIIVRGIHAKICDFGLARVVNPNETGNITTKTGSPNYMAPEMFRDETYNPFMVDVFAVGLIILATVTFVTGQRIEQHFLPSKKPLYVK